MAGSPVPSGGDLFDMLTGGSKERQALEQAIQKGLTSFIETADTEINKLIKANTVGPDVAADMLKLQKTIIDQTIAAIKAGPMGPSSGKS